MNNLRTLKIAFNTRNMETMASAAAVRIPNGSLRDDDEVNAERLRAGRDANPRRRPREIRPPPARSNLRRRGAARGRAVPARRETPLEVRDVQRLSARPAPEAVRRLRRRRHLRPSPR